MADVPVYSVVSQRKYKTSVLKPKWAWSWEGNTTANEIAMALSGCRSAIGQFGAKICAPIRRSPPCCHDLMISHAQKMQVFEKRSTEWSFFLANAGLLRDLSEFTQQDGKMLVCDKPGRVITYVFCCDLHFKGK